GPRPPGPGLVPRATGAVRQHAAHVVEACGRPGRPAFV
ncbi:MAG: hypothetical protein AVDCRST_MAG57-281, partial [uncultured Blastococcus sp.]